MQQIAAIAAINIVNTNFTKQNVSSFEKRTVADLIQGYTDPVTNIINARVPGILKGGKFSLLNGVLYFIFV